MNGVFKKKKTINAFKNLLRVLYLKIKVFFKSSQNNVDVINYLLEFCSLNCAFVFGVRLITEMDHNYLEFSREINKV